MDRLLVSFWDICLANLPEGGFTHRIITASGAKALIEEARTVGRLLGLADEDLLAPYGKRGREKHEALLKALRGQFGIGLSLRDFFSQDEDDDGPLYFTNGLNLADVNADSRMLVITCAYSFAPERPAGCLIIPCRNRRTQG